MYIDMELLVKTKFDGRELEVMGMTILTDRIHLVSDTSLEELHTFAIGVMGFRIDWFQNKPSHPHYDLTTPNARNRAIHNGARLVSHKAILQALLDAPYNVEYRKRWDARHTS